MSRAPSTAKPGSRVVSRCTGAGADGDGEEEDVGVDDGVMEDVTVVGTNKVDTTVFPPEVNVVVRGTTEVKVEFWEKTKGKHKRRNVKAFIDFKRSGERRELCKETGRSSLTGHCWALTQSPTRFIFSLAETYNSLPPRPHTSLHFLET
jgi:hypothetical protein